MAQIQEYTENSNLLENLLRDTSLINADDSIDSLAFDQMVEELPSGLLGSGVFAVSGTNEGISIGVDKPNAVGYIQSRNFVTGTTGWRIDSNGDVEFDSGTFRGTITATTGSIGGFDIGADYIRDVADSMGLASTVTAGDDVRFWAGDTFANRATADFRVTEAGVLTATSGTFGSWTISGNTFTTIADNMLIGTGAGGAITTGTDNVFVGVNSGAAITSGLGNICIGENTLQTSTTGSGNIFIGESVASNNSPTLSSLGNNNIAIGRTSATSIRDGVENVILGVSTGLSVDDENYNILVGGLANIGASGVNSSIAIGYSAQVTASNQLLIGGDNDNGYINDAYFGRGVVSATPVAVTLQNTGASGANVAGANFTIAGGKSTGSAAGGSLLFATSPAGGAGSALNALVTAMTISSTGVVTLLNDLALTEGGTGASTAAGARTNLGLGTAAVVNTDLADLNEATIESAIDTLANLTSASALATIGTVTTGVWNATDIPVSAGGTGLSTISALSIWLANSANVVTELTPGAGNSLRINAGGTAWEAYTPTTGNKISTVTTDVTVENTVTETNLISVSIPANTLGTNNAVKAKLYISDFDYSTTTTSNIAIRLKYGTTTLATANIKPFTSSVTNYSGYIEVMLLAVGATNSQEGSIEVTLIENLTAEAGEDTTSLFHQGANGTAVEDSTGALNLIVSAQWDAAEAGDKITLGHAIIEKIT